MRVCRACACVCVYVYRILVEPSYFRVLGVVGALGNTFQQTKLSLTARPDALELARHLPGTHPRSVTAVRATARRGGEMTPHNTNHASAASEFEQLCSDIADAIRAENFLRANRRKPH